MEQSPTRKPAFITDEAHSELVKLADLLKQNKGIKTNFISAASFAIINETRRQERLAERRQARQQQVVS